MTDKKQKPNLLVIMSDQLAAQFLPCYGHKVVYAPNIDKLASQGVVFDRAYTNSPLCAPSRFVFMSGSMPSAIRAWDNGSEFSSEVPTFAHYLSAENYRTALNGKMHFIGPDQLHGFETRLMTDIYPADFEWSPNWSAPTEHQDWFHNMEVVTKAGTCTRSMYLDYDDEVIFKSKQYLFDQAKDDNQQPFMLTVSMIQPHDPYLCRKEKWDIYSNKEIDLPITPYGTVEEDAHSKRLRDTYGASEMMLDDQTIINARRAYYATISDIDEKVGELMQTLEETGLKDNTIVIFTSDHGDMLGERGMWFKMSYLEHSARIPLIIHAPKMFSSGRVSRAVSLVDILPTLVELSKDGNKAGYASKIDGRSLLPHLSRTGGHDEVHGEYFAEGTLGPIFMILREGKKFISTGISNNAMEPDQYFDLNNDPHEHYNLVESKKHCAEIAALRDEISQRYNIDRLHGQILESQRRRHFLKDIMKQQKVSWDFSPNQYSSGQYIRSHIPIYELEKRARFPKR